MDKKILENYLNEMKLKKKAVGGYDPEDVILKMREMVSLIADNEDAPQVEKLLKLETELEEQIKLCKVAEEKVEELEEKMEELEECCTELELRLEEEISQNAFANNQITELKNQIDDLMHSLEAECSKNSAANDEITNLRFRLKESDSTSSISSDTKVQDFLSSLEAARGSILDQFQSQAIKEAEAMKKEAELLHYQNIKLKRIISEDRKAISVVTDDLLQQVQKIKFHLAELDQGGTDSENLL